MRTTALLTCLAAALGLAACGGGDSTTTDTVTTTTTTATTTTESGGGSASVNLTCAVTGLSNVQGGQTAARVTGKDVDPSQADSATCDEAETVVRGVTKDGAEEPVNVDGFQCTPEVTSTGPDVVSWTCEFRGADTATDITITFPVTYKS